MALGFETEEVPLQLETPQITLRFDRGTLLLEPAIAGQPLPPLPGALWDARVQKHRAPAHRYRDIVAALKRIPASYEDAALYRWGETGTFTPPELRPYQTAALHRWRESGGRGVVVLPTGAGKTVLAIAAIARVKAPALCLVPTKILLEQWRDRLHEQFGCEIGILGDGKKELQPITVTTFESAYRCMSWIGNRFRLLVVDEAHHFGVGIRDEALEMSTAPFRLGLTATPVGSGEAKRRLQELIGRQVYEATVSELTGHYLAPFKHETIHVDLYPDERRLYNEENELFRAEFDPFARKNPGFQWTDFVSYARQTKEGRRALVAQRKTRALLSFCRRKQEEITRICRPGETAKTLIFVSDTRTAYQVSRQLLVPALTGDIKKAEREEILEKFRRGILTCLVSCRVLNEGLDVPDAEVAVIVGGNLGEREHIQRIGRCLRPRPGKVARVIELVVRDSVEVRHWQKRTQTFATRKLA